MYVHETLGITNLSLYPLYSLSLTITSPPSQDAAVVSRAARLQRKQHYWLNSNNHALICGRGTVRLGLHVRVKLVGLGICTCRPYFSV